VGEKIQVRGNVVCGTRRLDEVFRVEVLLCVGFNLTCLA